MAQSSIIAKASGIIVIMNLVILDILLIYCFFACTFVISDRTLHQNIIIFLIIGTVPRKTVHLHRPCRRSFSDRNCPIRKLVIYQLVVTVPGSPV